MLKPLKMHFDEFNHKYVDENGNVVNSVSVIIGTAKHFEFIPREKQVEIMNKGSVLHQNVDYYVTTGDTLGEPLLEEFAKKYNQLQMMFGKYVTSERPLGAMYDGIAFAGKPDIVLEKAIIEVKSSLGSAERLYAMQLAAYGMLCEANDICKVDKYAIVYKKGNTWEFKVIADKYGGITPREAFIKALQIHHYKSVISKLENELHFYNNTI